MGQSLIIACVLYCAFFVLVLVFFFQAEDGIRDRSPSRGLGDVYKRQIHLKSVPAHNRPKQGLRLVIIIIVFCPGKLIGCPVYFFHDLGRIHASLFRIPCCSKLMSLGLVVFILSLASAPIA